MPLSNTYFKKQTIFIILTVNYYGTIGYYQLLPIQKGQRIPKQELYLQDYDIIKENCICQFATTLEDTNKKLEIFVKPEYTEGRFKIESCERKFGNVNIFKLTSKYNKDVYYLDYLISLVNNDSETTRCFIRHIKLLQAFESLNPETYNALFSWFRYIHRDLDEDGKLLKQFLENEHARTSENKLYLLLNLPECEELLENLYF